jgi:hypothetical protein
VSEAIPERRNLINVWIRHRHHVRDCAAEVYKRTGHCLPLFTELTVQTAEYVLHKECNSL